MNGGGTSVYSVLSVFEKMFSVASVGGGGGTVTSC
jgi:hypothetical protein